MGMLDKFKRDLGKNRGKAAVLGVLFVGMVVMSIRAVLELQPKSVVATPYNPNAAVEGGSEKGGVGSAADAETRINESKELWHRLREVKDGAASASMAFSFDASLYPPLPVLAPVTPATPEKPENVTIAPVAPIIDAEAIKAARIREQARALIVKSTAVGNSTTEPMAIVNQQLLTVGQYILGFEITAIRAREVEFKKENQITVVKMADGQ